MPFVYVIQTIIHTLFDTRRSVFNGVLNLVALIGSIWLTIANYGLKMIWIPLIICPLAGAIVGGIVAGMKQKRG